MWSGQASSEFAWRPPRFIKGVLRRRCGKFGAGFGTVLTAATWPDQRALRIRIAEIYFLLRSGLHSADRGFIKGTRPFEKWCFRARGVVNICKSCRFASTKRALSASGLAPWAIGWSMGQAMRHWSRPWARPWALGSAMGHAMGCAMGPYRKHRFSSGFLCFSIRRQPAGSALAVHRQPARTSNSDPVEDIDNKNPSLVAFGNMSA